MTRTKLLLGMALATTVVGARLPAQVPTDLPPVVPGAKPVTVEHVKIHGAALEGNLERNAVDRDAIVFLPPSYARETSRRYPVVCALHGYAYVDAHYRTIPNRQSRGLVVLAKWTANAPLAFVDQHVGNLRQYRAIAIDVGDQDRLRADAGKLHDVLDLYGVANTFEVYPGTHTSRVADRFQNHVMTFFSRNLCPQEGCR